MAITLPHSAITEIPNTEPAATPALWNTRYNEIDDNFKRLATYTPVGTSSTAAGTNAKAVTINGFSLSTNAFVLVKFSNANTASAPTLNVSNTGAKAIYFNGAAVPTGYLEANKFYHFVYDGSHWVLTGDVDVRHLYLPLAGGTITGNLAVQGTTTLTGLLTANGGVTTKKLTATELDLNGNADISGTLKVTGASTLTGLLTANGGVTTKVISATDVTASGTLKVTGATTLTGALAANGGTTTTTLKATGTSTLAAVNATNISASGTLKVTGATTLTGALAANGGLTTTTIKATGTSTLAAVNATNISASGTLSVTGTSTLTGKLTANGGVTTKALTATSLDLNGNGDVSGTWKVTGATTLTGLLTANGGVTTKKVTATELDLNGNGDVSGNLSVGGLLQVTGDVSVTGTIHVRNARPFAVTIPQISDITQPPSSEVQAWPVNVYDAQAHAIAMLKYIKKSNGESQWVLADIDYSDGDQHWAQLTIGHKADGTAYLRSDVPAEFGGGLGVSGGLFTVSGSGEVSGNWKVEGNVETAVLKGSMLQIEGSSGAHIVRQVKNYTKGQAPSNSMYIGHFLYGSGVTNQTSNRVAGNEIAISSSGNVTYTFSCYEPVAGSTKTTTLRLGYGDESWINLDADNVNLASTVNVNGALNVNNNDVSVKGWIRLTGNVESSGTQPFKLTAGALDVKAAPTSNIQLWPLGVYDKNGLAVAYIKYNKYTDGRQNIQLLSRYVREDDTYELTGLSVGHRADGTFYTDVPHPVTESNDNSIATTKWVRDLLLSAVPTGTILPFAGKTVPSGFLSCNKANVSRTTYAKLFSIIGTTYGSGDGSTTFTLPDYRNRFVMGANTASEVGTYLESGAPNITGQFNPGGLGITASGAFKVESSSQRSNDGENSDSRMISFDASLSNPIYGRSSEIQPPSGKALWIIKF